MKSNSIILLTIIGISSLLFSSCNTVKYVADNEHLLTKNTVTVNEKKNISNDVNDFIIQRPNRKALGVPISLHFYNLGNSDFLSPYEIWKDSFPGREKTFSNVFSEKQSRAYRNSRYKFNQWFFKKGDAPVILDTLKTRLTAEELQLSFIYQGYFRAKIEYKENRNGNKRATVEYDITTGKVFHVDSIITAIKTPVLDSIFELHKEESLIKEGIEFNFNYFEEEADRITALYRNSGVYHFTRSAIEFEGDSTSNDYKSDITLSIDNRVVQKNDDLSLVPYQIQKVSKVNIFTDYSFDQKDNPYPYSEEYNGFTFNTHEPLKYNSKLFSKFIFIEPDSIYRDDNTDLTRRNLRRLINFRLVNIKYDEIDSTNLAANIYLTPFKKHSFAVDTELTHSNVKQLGISGKVSLLIKNVFKDAGIMSFSVQGAFYNSTDAATDNNSFFNAWEFGADVSLDVPRIIAPFNTERWISKKMLPKTQFTVGTSFQKNIGLDKQKFTGIANYNWESSKTNSHRLDIINTQFIKNLNIDSYFNIYRSEYNELVDVSDVISETHTIPADNYDENGDLIPLTFIDYMLDPTNDFEDTNPIEYQQTQNIEKQYDIITENVVVPLIAYEFIYNNRESFKDANYSFFRARFASAGLLTTAVAKAPEDGGKKEVLGIPVAQYLKLDLEYKKFWGKTTDPIIAFRAFLGIAVPYGNSEDMPFSRSYFIGGANDLRAWKVYELGPGGTKTGLEYNVGSLKFLTSLEYRFDIINNFKGALFVDAGNIWDITNSDIIAPEGKFTGFSSLANIAVGSGIGLRYDFNFLVIRLDTGFKTYEPYQPNGKKWFTNYNFARAVYNIGINYPF